MSRARPLQFSNFVSPWILLACAWRGFGDNPAGSGLILSAGQAFRPPIHTRVKPDGRGARSRKMRQSESTQTARLGATDAGLAHPSRFVHRFFEPPPRDQGRGRRRHRQDRTSSKRRGSSRYRVL